MIRLDIRKFQGLSSNVG